MLNALEGMQNDKSPGLDGLPVEFYNLFWQDIKRSFSTHIWHPLIKVFLVYLNTGGNNSYIKTGKILRAFLVGDTCHY